jgi:hypothetical protein
MSMEMWTAGTLDFKHNNPTVHTALPIEDFLTKHSIPVIPHHPYSPDLSPPCFFYLHD